jgi:hypothetical protein
VISLSVNITPIPFCKRLGRMPLDELDRLARGT